MLSELINNKFTSFIITSRLPVSSYENSNFLQILTNFFGEKMLKHNSNFDFIASNGHQPTL